MDDLFGLTRKPRDCGHAAAIKGWAKRAFGLGEDASVMVTELRCSEPGCPPLETVIALLDATGPARQRKIHKPIADVTEADVRAMAAKEEEVS
jgi:hypothetical protein